MSKKDKISIFWFRRDLRLGDNRGLYKALNGDHPVLPLFIFDTQILDKLEDCKDARVMFIHDQVLEINKILKAKKGSFLLVKHGKPMNIFKQLTEKYDLQAVYTNRDYEPYAKERDNEIAGFLHARNINFFNFKDQVIFDRDEILSNSGEPYKVFTPYSKKWKGTLSENALQSFPTALSSNNFYKEDVSHPPNLQEIGFERSNIVIPSKEVQKDLIQAYSKKRDFPAEQGTSRLGIHLRFGTVSIRQLVKTAIELNDTWLNELIWREFYMMILDFNPQVVNEAFKPKYDLIRWCNNEEEFLLWCNGQTGIPIIDAGMRELNETGFMHNRVRMIVASFLTKNLLIDWRWGEAYFAQKLLDYELASNNGNWQWAAGSGVDAQPYFRVFNPESQAKTYDPQGSYIKKWVPEIGTKDYPKPMVNIKETRIRAIQVYKESLKQNVF